jgi:hypothetical protein
MEFYFQKLEVLREKNLQVGHGRILERQIFGGVGGLCLCKVVKWEEVCLRDIKLGWEEKSVFMHYNEKRKRKEVFCGGRRTENLC